MSTIECTETNKHFSYKANQFTARIRRINSKRTINIHPYTSKLRNYFAEIIIHRNKGTPAKVRLHRCSGTLEREGEVHSFVAKKKYADIVRHHQLSTPIEPKCRAENKANEVWSSVGESGKKNNKPKVIKKGVTREGTEKRMNTNTKKSTSALGTNSVGSTRLADDLGNLPRGWKVHWSEQSVTGRRKE